MPAPARLVCFAHGKESGPWGTKITHLAAVARRRGYAALSPDYSDTHDPRARVARLLELAPQAEQTLVLVGSSMGGYVSAQACAALRPQGLLLLAPALYFPGFDEEPADVPPRTHVVHGRDDEIVPLERAERFSRTHNAVLHVLPGGHTLNEHLPTLARILEWVLDEAEQAHG
jgi:pimeloyl-ACP methyl ester carboxylesterase